MGEEQRAEMRRAVTTRDHEKEKEQAMGGVLWGLIALLVVFWLVGLMLDLVGGLIHIALVVAAVLFVVNMFMSRTRT